MVCGHNWVKYYHKSIHQMTVTDYGNLEELSFVCPEPDCWVSQGNNVAFFQLDPLTHTSISGKDLLVVIDSKEEKR